MTTRSMTKIRMLESKLQQTLDELQTKNNLCDKLLQEREESEREVEIVISRNTALKNEMSSLYAKYNNLIEQRDQLQAELEKYFECGNTHEQALSRIRLLE